MIEIEIEGSHHEYWYTVAEVAKLVDLKITVDKKI
jgi:hypothetical protein